MKCPECGEWMQLICVKQLETVSVEHWYCSCCHQSKDIIVIGG